MAKKHKVKRYYGKDVGFYRAKPHPLVVVLVVAVLVGLGFLGTVIYEPVYDFIMNIGKQNDSPASMPELDESVPESGPGDAPEPEPEPEPELEPPLHDNLKTIYVPHEIVSDSARLESFLAELSGTEINAVMIDIKNQDGVVLFKTANEKAAEWNAVDPAAVDLKQLSQYLSGKGFLLVARMSVFRDPLAAGRGHRDYAIGYRGEPSALWLDNASANGGKPWLNPYSSLSQDYIESLAREAAGSGIDMLVLESVRFPDNSSTYAVFNSEESEPDKSRAEILRQTLSRIDAITSGSGVRLAAFYTALEPTLTENEQDRYGGSLLNILSGTLLLDVRPALFGGDYSQAGLSITSPLENPAGAAAAALQYVKSGVSSGVTVIPYIQGGNVERFNGGSLYGKEQVDAQIKAITDLGCNEYCLYSADGIYYLK